MSTFLKIDRKAFTLIELMLVLGIIVTLASIIFLSLNPNRQLAQARDAQRRSNIGTILNAVAQYAIDNNGNLPGNLSGAVLTTGTTYKICLDGNTTRCTPYGSFAIIARALTGSYIVRMPQDSRYTGSGYTGYSIMRNASGRITVYATSEVNSANTFSVSR